MRRDALLIAASFMLSGALAPDHALAQAPDFSGIYRCEPQPQPCRLGNTYTITQTGNDLVVTAEGGEEGHGWIAGDTVLTVGAPFNSLGVVHEGGIEWSNGTKWYRQ